MKKVFLFAALAGMFLASCSNDEFFGTTEATSNTNEIGFNLSVPNLTRGTSGGSSAAQKLNNNFVVYGFKYMTEVEPTAAKDVAKASKQQDVFKRYNVNYIGNAGTSKTNAKGWEYVGYNDLQGASQDVKYWDYSAKGYVFSAISGVGLNSATLKKTAAGATVYDKGWTVTIPAGGSLSALYASNRVPVVKEAKNNVFKYPETVDLTFYSMATKIRFGIYETVPGYSIHIDKFYCQNKNGNFTKVSNTTTNFGINGKFMTPDVKNDTELEVTYYDGTDSDLENRPKVSLKTAVELANPKSALFGTNMQATPSIGETSATATYDKDGGEYTFILPYADAANDLKLYVDFTLTANGTGETIKVYQARAFVPAAYTQWKENFAYTYLFKIADNTTGTTGTPKDPNNPEEPWDPSDPRDPEGLYTITFDACVVNTEAGLPAEGVQETVTSTAAPSITTYAEGINATENADYKAGTIYYNAMSFDKDTKSLNPVDANLSAVYEVVYNGTATVTEALVADYSKGNGVLLVPVATKAETSVPLSDGSSVTFAPNQCNSFVAKEGKKYAIIYTVDGVETIKLVRVVGTDSTTPAYKVGVTSGAKITTLTGNVVCKITDNTSTATDKGIKGAIPFITVEKGGKDVTAAFNISAGAGVGRYVFTLVQDSILAGANGTYTVKFKDVAAANTFEVDLSYAIVYTPATATEAEVVAGATPNTVKLTVGGFAQKGGKIEKVHKDLSVKDNGDGTYTISADKDAMASGSVGCPEYNFTIAGLDVQVKVKKYLISLDGSITATSATIDWPEGGDPEKIELKLLDVVDAYGVPGAIIASSNTDVHPGDTVTGDQYATKLSVTPLTGGFTQFSYENAKFDYTVNQYELTSSVAEITRTQSTKLTFWLNGEQQNAAAATVKVYKKKGDSYPTEHLTSGYTLTSNGRDLTFGNVSVAGTYRIDYTDGKATPTVLGFEEITVTND